MTAGPVLVLGGTGEARQLAAALVDGGIPVTSSLAGRVQRPRLPVGEVRIGGFGGRTGLADWLVRHRVRAVVDATHPFAATITGNAAAAAAATGIPLLRLARAPWIAGPDDDWTQVPTLAVAAENLRQSAGRRPGLRVMLTTGRQDAHVFADVGDAWFLIRVVDPPTGALPRAHRILRSRGPYTVESESELLRDNEIDVLVTKNSGGSLTSAKLVAAARLGIPVLMVDRPVEPDTTPRADDVGAAVDWVRDVLSRDGGA